MNQKGFVPILVILLVLAAIGGVYYFGTLKNKIQINPNPIPEQTTQAVITPTLSPTIKPTTDPTANWKVFNHTFGYSLRYPENIQVIPLELLDEGSTPPNQYGDIVFSEKSGFGKPHLRVLRLTKEYVDSSGQTLMQMATSNYKSNLDLQFLPAVSIQAPKQDTFSNIPAVSYVLKNKGFKAISDEHLGFDGEYHVVWLDKNGYRYFIYWTKDNNIDQVVATIKFINQ